LCSKNHVRNIEFLALKRITHFAVIVTGALLYLCALAVQAPGTISIDQFELWLVGLFGWYLIWFASIVLRRHFEIISNSSFTQFRWIWPITLIVFIFMRTTRYGLPIEFWLLGVVGFGNFAAKLSISLVYSTISAIFLLPFVNFREPGSNFFLEVLLTFVAVLVNAVLFSLLVI
jgi:hypothetical protein